MGQYFKFTVNVSGFPRLLFTAITNFPSTSKLSLKELRLTKIIHEKQIRKSKPFVIQY